MRCQKLRSLLPAYCKNELTTSVTASIERHFHQCEKCREDLAAHRLIARTVSYLADSAMAEKQDASEVVSPPLFEQQDVMKSESLSQFTQLKVSGEFNNRLMERIAQERYAETRAKAHTRAFLPQKAPLFAYRRLVPALVSVTAVAALAFISAQQGLFNGLIDTNKNQIATQENSGQTNVAFTPAHDPALDAPALGERLGLSDEYMTAQPVNNPVYAGATPSASQNTTTPSTGNNASLVSAQGSRPLSSSRRWQFARDFERSRRIWNIAEALCRRGTYFRVMQFDANGAPIGPVGGVVFQCGPSVCAPVGQRVVGVPQIIVQPLPNAPMQQQAPQGQTGRMVSGSF